jgi:Flp pilus assembly protein TadD
MKPKTTSARTPESGKAAAAEGGSRWAKYAVLGVVCALVIGFYAGSANSGVLELMGSGAQASYYNLQVQGFRDGHLSVNRQLPPEFGDPPRFKWERNYGFDDLSYYKGKLYLYFGVTPALALFWPYVAVTGHYLLHRDAAVIFFSAGFLAGAGLLWAVWRRYFKESGVGTLAAGTLALGLGNFVPPILGRCDVYEVAVGCGYALTMLALGGVWCAMQDERRRWRWLAAASLAYGLAVAARPSLLLGAVILLAPVFEGWREKRRVWPLLLAAGGPIVAIGVGLMIYNAVRFDNPLEFGQRYQLPLVAHQQFSLRYLWFNFRVGFLKPAHWNTHFPFVDNIAVPALPAGYCQLDEAYGVLSNLPVVWLALAAPLAWRGRTEEEARSKLRWFCGAVALLFGMCVLLIVLHDSVCMRYEMEYVSPLVLLAVVGVFALERALAGRPVWRRAARCGWGLLLAFTVAFNLFASYKSNADGHQNFGFALLETGRVDEAITQFQKTLQMRPDGEAAHDDLGAALEQMGKVDEAIAEYQKAVQIDPDFVLGHNNLGNAFLKKGRVDESLAQYQKAVDIQPDDLEALCGFGYALLQSGRVDEAITQYQQALRIKPDYAEGHFSLGNALLKKGRVDEAFIQYQQALQIQPDYADACNNLGNILLQKGRVDEAILLFQKALEIKPDYAEACNNLGSSLARKGRVDEAIGQYQKALQLSPDYAAAHINLAIALQQNGRVDEAIPQYQQALQLKPADPATENYLAWVLATAPEASLRNGAKALELARQANSLTGGENPVVLHTLAAACAEAGRFSEAVETAQHALRLAQAQTNTALAGALQEELKLYQAGSPLHGLAQPH